MPRVLGRDHALLQRDLVGVFGCFQHVRLHQQLVRVMSCSLKGLDWKCCMEINAFTTGAMCPESQHILIKAGDISHPLHPLQFCKNWLSSACIGKKLGGKQAGFGLKESILNCLFVVFQTVRMAGCSTSNQPQFAYIHTSKWREWSPFKNRGIWGPAWPLSALSFSFGSVGMHGLLAALGQCTEHAGGEMINKILVCWSKCC